MAKPKEIKRGNGGRPKPNVKQCQKHQKPNTNNHQVFIHFVLVKDSLNYQLELVVNVEPLYNRWFFLLSKRCNTWSTLLRVVPPQLSLLSPRSLIVRSKKISDLLKNSMFLSSSPILQNQLNLTPFFYYFKFNLIFLVFI